MAAPGRSTWVALTLGGELDIGRIEELNLMAAGAVEGDAVNVIVDLTEVTFLDSSALGWLLRFQDRLERTAGHLRIVTTRNGNLARLISLTGLEGHFIVFPTYDAAKQEPPTGLLQVIDEMLTFFADPDRDKAKPSHFQDGDGAEPNDVWERATLAGYTEWTGLGYRLTDKGRERGKRLVEQDERDRELEARSWNFELQPPTSNHEPRT